MSYIHYACRFQGLYRFVTWLATADRSRVSMSHFLARTGGVVDPQRPCKIFSLICSLITMQNFVAVCHVWAYVEGPKTFGALGPHFLRT